MCSTLTEKAVITRNKVVQDYLLCATYSKAPIDISFVQEYHRNGTCNSWAFHSSPVVVVVVVIWRTPQFRWPLLALIFTSEFLPLHNSKDFNVPQGKLQIHTAFPDATMRLSGLQREVLGLYRTCLRESRKKPHVRAKSRPFERITHTSYRKLERILSRTQGENHQSIRIYEFVADTSQKRIW